jgi:hypoxanthine-guanine phosphoribosyltransferase
MNNQTLSTDQYQNDLSPQEQVVLDFIKSNFEVSRDEIIHKLVLKDTEVDSALLGLLNKTLVTQKGLGLDSVYCDQDESIELENKPDNILSQQAELLNHVSQSIMGGIWEAIFKETKHIRPEYSVEDFAKCIEFINQNYLYISPAGHLFSGDHGLVEWADKNNPDITFLQYAKLRLEYIDTVQKYQKFFNKEGLVDATKKFQLTFKNQSDINGVFYCDFYAIERFGKTKLGNLMLYGKLTQNLDLIQQACFLAKPKILSFIKDNNIDAICFVPPTLDRNIQFMDELAKHLQLKIPIISIKKLINQVAVPQKTIKNTADRIINADNIVLGMNESYQNILMIDDAVGSGSTFAVVASKLRRRKVALNKIFALAIVGSANGVIDNNKQGWEIVNEV